MNEASGSGSRMDVVKRELVGVLENYPAGDMFNIVFFSSDVFPWLDSLAQMNERNRDEALDFIDRQQPAGGTAIYDGLEAAFEDPLIDTIYLLSDGHATAGRLTDSDMIRAEIERMNSARKIQINCVAVGQQHPLLRAIATDTKGTYRFIN